MEVLFLLFLLFVAFIIGVSTSILLGIEPSWAIKAYAWLTNKPLVWLKDPSGDEFLCIARKSVFGPVIVRHEGKTHHLQEDGKTSRGFQWMPESPPLSDKPRESWADPSSPDYDPLRVLKSRQYGAEQ